MSSGLGCRPVNVVETSPKPRSCCYNLDLKSGSELECIPDVEEQNTSFQNCDSTRWDEPKEDFYDDCITPDEFARCLNLVPKEKLKNESVQLKSSFSLRQISRTKEFQVPEDLRDVKVYDYMPVTSSFGIKMLKLSEEKNFYSDQLIEMKIKHYDSFCRFQLNTSSVCSNFPKLRCREKKEYPVCITQRFLRYTPTHMYAFNKRQRLEKLITFKTGLDTRSRRLLQKCNNKRLEVSINRLTPEEINMWPQKSSKIGPILADYIRAEEPSSMSSDSDETVIEPNSPFYIDVELISSDSSESSDSDDPSVYPVHKKTVKFKGVLNSSKPSLCPIRRRNGHFSKFLNKPQRYTNCYVKVKNVLSRIQRCFGNYYVAGTDIRIPFLNDFLSSLDQKVLSGIFIPEINRLINSRHDHAYHRPFSQEAYRKNMLNSKCLIHKTSTPKLKDLLKKSNCVRSKSNSSVKFNYVKDSNPLKSSINKSVFKSGDIPVIDLTSDLAPNSSVKEIKYAQKSNILNSRFHCYGCGYKQVSMEKNAAYSLAAQHMKDFHCVSDIKAFLNASNNGSGVILEAFPGYKGSSIN